MRVAFQQFWPGFQARESFFFRFLDHYGFEPELASKSDRLAELEFISVFPKRSELLVRKAHNILLRSSVGGSERALANTSDELSERIGKKRIWFTGENIRVPSGEDFDFSMSYEQDGYGGTNVYFPLWYTHLDWFGKPEFNHRVGLDLTVKQLLEKREFRAPQSKFACAFIGNPHPMRSRVIGKMAELGNVDVFGKAVGKPVRYKHDVAKDYKFTICFENDLYPGYVTEKLLDAYLSGTVPFYWGDLGLDLNINRKCFINLADFESIADALRFINKLDTETYRDLFEQPFLLSQPSIKGLLEIVKSV